ncbi:hypothetical protein EYF80_007196 [Liparis tanakae]|uniref:Uncharacterized protein n=1 Tax=Liparis tanakae TaxID=230148 RepID=A0A4Z2IYV2_9TELE|nr:hypothetical protein EYF80_007196 [Liparis tanakae]
MKTRFYLCDEHLLLSLDLLLLPRPSALYEAARLSEDDQRCVVERKPLGFGQQPAQKPKHKQHHFNHFNHVLPLPLQTSARWQPLSPGSLQNSTTSRHVVSGVMGTSVKACSPSLSIFKHLRVQRLRALQHLQRSERTTRHVYILSRRVRRAGMVCTYRHHLGSSGRSKPGSIGELTDGSPTSSPRPTFGSSGLWLLQCDNRLGPSPLCQPRHYNDVQCYTTERYNVK